MPRRGLDLSKRPTHVHSNPTTRITWPHRPHFPDRLTHPNRSCIRNSRSQGSAVLILVIEARKNGQGCLAALWARKTDARALSGLVAVATLFSLETVLAGIHQPRDRPQVGTLQGQQ